MAEPLPSESVAAPAPEETLAPAEASAVQRSNDGRIIMRARDGSLQVVGDDQAERFIAEGRGLPATAGDVRESDLQRQYGEGIGTEIRTGLEAAADVATLGGYSLGTRLIGGDEAAEGQRERYARSPVAKTVGELAAIGTLAVATGGAGAVGTAARLTPAGAALRAGMAVERGLSGSTALSQIGALTAASAVEGALFGTGLGVQEIALSERDTDRTAEAVLAHLGRTAGEGMVFGALAGAGGALVSKGLGAAARGVTSRAKRALQRGEDGVAAGARSGADAAVDASGRSSTRARTTSASALEQSVDARLANRSDITISLEAAELPDVRRPLQRLQDQASAAKRLEAQREAFVPSVTKGLTEIDDAADQLAAMARKVKPGNAERALQQSPIANYEATVARGAELLDAMTVETQRFLDDDLLREGMRGRGASSLAKVREASAAVRGALPQGLSVKQGATYWKAQADNAAQLWGELNYYKAIVGRAADNAKDSSARAALDSHYHAVQQYLEDETLWGGMARLNQTVNPGWSRWLTAKTVDADLLSEAPRKSLSDPFRQGRQGDSAKAQGLFDALGDVRGSTRAQDAAEWIEAQGEFARLVGEAYELGPEGRALVKKVLAQRDDIAKQINEAVRTHHDAKQFRELGGALNELPMVAQAFKSIKVGVSSVSNAATSASTKSSARAGADATSTALATSSANAAAREQLAQRAGRLQSLRSASSSVLGSVATAARALATGSRQAIRAALPAAAATAQVSSTLRFEKAWRATADFEADPQAAVRRAWRAQGDLARYAPSLAAAQAARVATLGQLLSDKLPRHRAPSIYGDEPEVPKVTPAERDEFLRYWRAANDPLSVIEDAADGRLSPEGIEVLKTGYPELYQSLRMSTLDALQSADSKPSYQRRLLLGQLLELPTDPGLEPDMLAALQQSAQSSGVDEQSQQVLSPSRRSTPDVSGAQQTRTGRLQAQR